jgi:hypothetical protein
MGAVRAISARHRPPRRDPTARVSIQLELAADDAAYRAGTFGATQIFTIPLAARRVRPDGTVALSLMSGEQYLQDYKLPYTVEDISLWANQSSLRSIVYNIMNRALGAGFALDFDALDQTFNTFSELTNLIENPSFEIANAEGWTPANCDVERATDWAAIGNYSGPPTRGWGTVANTRSRRRSETAAGSPALSAIAPAEWSSWPR